MKKITCQTKQEFNNLLKSFEEDTVVHIKFSEPCHVEEWGNSHVEAWGNSHVEAWGNSHVVARGNSHVEARGNSHVVARGNSHVEARGNSHVVARGNSHVVARGNSHVVAYENSHVEAWGNNTVKNYSENTKITLMVFSVCWMIKKCKKLTKSKTATIIDSNYDNTVDKFLELHGISTKTKTVKLFKRVSKDLKTQENTSNETTWYIGSTLTVPNWNPDQECGAGKFHACLKTFFCDEFRGSENDRYILIEVKKEDLHTHKNPQYPHKIAFKQGRVICEVDRNGNPIKA